MPQWDAEVYLKFANERTQPSLDLIHRINLENPERIIDLGCGPGNSTQALRRRWPNAAVVGLDSSPQMIETARQTYTEGIWEVGDAAPWTARKPFDLVFSNAMLQWLPNHAGLCRHMFDQVAVGVRSPSNSPTTTILRCIAKSSRCRRIQPGAAVCCPRARR